MVGYDDSGHVLTLQVLGSPLRTVLHSANPSRSRSRNPSPNKNDKTSNINNNRSSSSSSSSSNLGENTNDSNVVVCAESLS